MPINYPTVNAAGELAHVEHMTTTELAELLNVTVRTVQRRVRDGVWPYTWGGRAGALFSPEDVALIVGSLRHPGLPDDPRGLRRYG